MSAAIIGLAVSSCLSAQTLEVQVGDKVGTIELNGNDAAQSFVSQFPLKIKFEDFGSTERIAYLPQKLRARSSPTSCTPRVGDLTYYMPWGNLAVFVKDFRHSESLIPLGKLSSEALEAIKTGKNAVVEIRLIGKK